MQRVNQRYHVTTLARWNLRTCKRANVQTCKRAPAYIPGSSVSRRRRVRTGSVDTLDRANPSTGSGQAVDTLTRWNVGTLERANVQTCKRVNCKRVNVLPLTSPAARPGGGGGCRPGAPTWARIGCRPRSRASAVTVGRTAVSLNRWEWLRRAFSLEVAVRRRTRPRRFRAIPRPDQAVG